MRKRAVLVGVATAAALGFGAAGATPAMAACGIDANIVVSKNGDGSRYVRGGGNAYCSPPVSANYLSVNVSPQNIAIGLLVPGSSHSASNSCSNGACSITPLSWGYTVPANAIMNLLSNNGPVCFTASYTALNGGSTSRTACG